jgi:hypothetical protein
MRDRIRPIIINIWLKINRTMSFLDITARRPVTVTKRNKTIIKTDTTGARPQQLTTSTNSRASEPKTTTKRNKTISYSTTKPQAQQAAATTDTKPKPPTINGPPKKTTTQPTNTQVKTITTIITIHNMVMSINKRSMSWGVL